MKLSATISVSRRPRTDNEAELASVITNKTMQMGLKDFDQAVKDLKGAGIVVGEDQMTLEASKVKITNNGTTAALFTDGKVSADYIDAKTIVTNGLQANTIDAKDATIENLSVKNVHVSGTMRSDIQYIDSDTVATTDNFSVGNASSVNLGLTSSNNIGRTIRLINYKWNGVLTTGECEIKLPSGYYFFENGIKKTSIKLSRQCVTLFGYGDNGTFLGWIILDRNDVDTANSYGMPIRCIAVGRVTVGRDYDSSTQKYIIDYAMHCHSFDNSSAKIERTGVGMYKITFTTTKQWFASPSDALVMTTGIGLTYMTDYPYNLSGSYAKATVAAIETSSTSVSITVNVSDDETSNDGNFSFMIYNCSDFNWR